MKKFFALALVCASLLTFSMVGCDSKDSGTNKMKDGKMTDGKMGDGKMTDGKMKDGKMSDGK